MDEVKRKVEDICDIVDGLKTKTKSELGQRREVDQRKLDHVLNDLIKLSRGLPHSVEIFDPRPDANDLYMVTQDPSKPEEVFLSTLQTQHSPLDNPRESLENHFYETLKRAGIVYDPRTSGTSGGSGGFASPNGTTRYRLLAY
jgi:hypothetical protein